jgi:hypothetical protein
MSMGFCTGWMMASEARCFFSRKRRYAFSGFNLKATAGAERATHNYGQGRAIYTGPRGGEYYINESGKRVYGTLK